MSRERFRPDDYPHDHFLLTTVVGSHPKPEWLSVATEIASADRRREARNDACRLAIWEYEQAGLDVVTDGEMRRVGMIDHFVSEGDQPRLSDAEALAEEFAFADRVADAPVKFTLTGPYTLARWGFEDRDPAEIAPELARRANAVVQRLAEAGVTYLQIDEPCLGRASDDPAVVGNCLERLVCGVPESVRVSLHSCSGNYADAVPELYDYPIDEFHVAFAGSDRVSLDCFRDPAFTADLGLGVVDTGTATIESVEEIRARIERGLSVVPPDRLTVAPDCGLRTMPRSVARRNVENVVAAAREVEAALDDAELDFTN